MSWDGSLSKSDTVTSSVSRMGLLVVVPCASRNAPEACNNCLPEAECRMRSLILVLYNKTLQMADRLARARFTASPPLLSPAPHVRTGLGV